MAQHHMLVTQLQIIQLDTAGNLKMSKKQSSEKMGRVLQVNISEGFRYFPRVEYMKPP